MLVYGITDQMAWAVFACFAMMILDVISGFIGAIMEHNVNSTKMREGLFHKGALIMLIVIAWVCEVFVMHVPDIGLTVPLVIPACVLIFTMELVSILENVSVINPELKGTKLLELFNLDEKEIGGDHVKRD